MYQLLLQGDATFGGCKQFIRKPLCCSSEGKKKDQVNDQCLHILDVFHSLMTHHGSSQVRSDGLEVSEEWQAHDLEAWCVSFSKVEVSVNSRMSRDA